MSAIRILVVLALIAGVCLLWLIAIGIVSKVHAGDAFVIEAKPGQRIAFRCEGGTFSGPTSGSTIAWQCNADNGEPPPPPPPECGDPDLPLSPRTEQKLPVEQEFVNVFGDTVRVYYFDSNDYVSTTGRISVAPTAYPSGTASDLNLTVLSPCIGDLAIDDKPRACWSAGNQNNISWTVGKGGTGICGLAPDTRYRLNISPRNPITDRNMCNGTCSIVVNTGTH